MKYRYVTETHYIDSVNIDIPTDAIDIKTTIYYQMEKRFDHMNRKDWLGRKKEIIEEKDVLVKVIIIEYLKPTGV